jgi:hypothetical protein
MASDRVVLHLKHAQPKHVHLAARDAHAFLDRGLADADRVHLGLGVLPLLLLERRPDRDGRRRRLDA